MREHLYALGVSLIEIIQYWFVEWEPFFEQVNSFYNPGNMLEVLFPVVAFIDSVFASQLLLVTSFGGCLNGILKWWLLEDRPYWWVRETTYYTGTARPKLYQTAQTCETGPGCPSGHTAMAASILILAIMWISHILNDSVSYIREPNAERYARAYVRRDALPAPVSHTDDVQFYQEAPDCGTPDRSRLCPHVLRSDAERSVGVRTPTPSTCPQLRYTRWSSVLPRSLVGRCSYPSFWRRSRPF
ncbi:unnamed protein product [Leptidea sinapis]|uniref:glucose-6-phosphatase n=1 Tax=Leptidea sinapis TaxID=189913 RepID=A0A5E4PTM1_9NEOP|nr:unnamed protein product [Leptidea sinapis]